MRRGQEISIVVEKNIVTSLCVKQVAHHKLKELISETGTVVGRYYVGYGVFVKNMEKRVILEFISKKAEESKETKVKISELEEEFQKKIKKISLP